MTAIFYILLSLLLIIIQTTIIPYLAVFRHLYDLLIPLVLYLGLYRPIREGLPAALLLGLVMDNLSGGPFGLYMTAYFWMFVIVKWGMRFLQVRNRVLLWIVLTAGIFIENLIFIGTLRFLADVSRSPTGVFHSIGAQMLWGVFTGPILLLLIRYVHKRSEEWFRSRVATWNEQRS